MLTVENLCFSYGRQPVFRDISFRLEKGELCGLFGPNGTGKTTLFKCCLKFFPPHGGTIRFQGRDIRNLTTRQLARQVAYVPQFHRAAFSFTAGQMVLMGRTPHLGRLASPSVRDRDLALEAMDRLDILDLAQQPFDRLSGGQQQMVLIARAIAQDTGIIFLDEPTAALDFKNQIRLWETLRTIADRGTAILACTHDPNHVAWFCHSAVVMGNQGIVAKGAPGDVLCQEVMDRIYEDTCRVRSLDGVTVMLPGTLAARQGNLVAFPDLKKKKRNP